MPRTRAYNQTDVLEGAARAFWAKGYDATSISDLTQATGINRGSMYTAFADKRSLFLAALEHYDIHYREQLLAANTRRYPPRDGIMEVFENAAANTGSNGTPPGCLLVNTAVEVAPHDEPVSIFVENSLEQVRQFFHTAIERAHNDGTIGREIEPLQTSHALLGLLVGLRVLTRIGTEASVLKTITSQARAMLG